MPSAADILSDGHGTNPTEISRKNIGKARKTSSFHEILRAFPCFEAVGKADWGWTDTIDAYVGSIQ